MTEDELATGASTGTPPVTVAASFGGSFDDEVVDGYRRGTDGRGNVARLQNRHGELLFTFDGLSRLTRIVKGRARRRPPSSTTSIGAVPRNRAPRPRAAFHDDPGFLRDVRSAVREELLALRLRLDEGKSRLRRLSKGLTFSASR